jgi:hypothetical protein
MAFVKRDRQTDTHTHTLTHTLTQRERERERKRERERERNHTLTTRMTSFDLNPLLKGRVSTCSHTGGQGFNI